MANNEYPLVVFWSKEDGEYVAVAPDLPGCSATGETQEDAVREARIAVDLWIEAWEERGWPVPPPNVDQWKLVGAS